MDIPPKDIVIDTKSLTFKNIQTNCKLLRQQGKNGEINV